MASQVLECLFGVLKSDKEILEVIREEQPWQEAAISLAYTIFTCLLINIPILFFEHKLLTASKLTETIATLFSNLTFSQYLIQNLRSFFWPIIILVVAWLAFSGLFHLLAMGFKTETDFLTFLSFTGFLLPFEILFCLAYLVFYIGAYLQSTPVIFLSFALGVAFFIWFVRALIYGSAEIYEFEKKNAAYIFFIILLLIGAAASGGYYLIRPW